MTKEKRVGIFVAGGLLILAIGVFLIGENRKFWQRKVSYNAVYSNVAGLRPGSPVAMGGVDVGTVSKVKYSEDPKDPHIYVQLEIVRSQAERMLADPRARDQLHRFHAMWLRDNCPCPICRHPHALERRFLLIDQPEPPHVVARSRKAITVLNGFCPSVSWARLLAEVRREIQHP